MLWAHVENELLDLALFDLDDGELITRVDPVRGLLAAPDLSGGYL
jgi:hypothetical protein